MGGRVADPVAAVTGVEIDLHRVAGLRVRLKAAGPLDHCVQCDPADDHAEYDPIAEQHDEAGQGRVHRGF